MCNEGLVHKRLLVNKNIFMALADRSDIFWKKLPERRARDLRMALADFSVAHGCGEESGRVAPLSISRTRLFLKTNILCLLTDQTQISYSLIFIVPNLTPKCGPEFRVW